VLGDKEVEIASVAVRLRSGEQLPAQSLESFIESVSRLIASRSKDLV